MRVHYINLPRRQDRNDRFLRLNESLADLRRIDAVDGRTLQAADLLREGVVAEPLRAYTPGALGAALSHKRAWEQCVADAAPMTIAEDDAVLNRHFCSQAAGVLDGLPPDWDIVLWGWNFDAILHVEIFEGLKRSVMRFDSRRLAPDIADFQERRYPVQPLRLIATFGLVCYSVSAPGARRLASLCFPLKNERISVPGMRARLPNAGLDTVMNRHYGELRAYACFPPLVWTDNDKGTSDIHPRGPWLRRAWGRVVGKMS